MRIEKIYFNTEDNTELFGLLHTSENQTDKEVVIAIHGMGSNCFKQRDDIIAQKLTSNNISYFSFNNRGFGLVNKITKNGSGILQGTAFEDVKDSYYDIVSAIKLMASKGYEKIHLQGHSLGSTKSVYVYNKLLQNNETKILNKIGSVILLSLVDLTSVMQFLVKNADEDVIKIAEEKEAEKQLNYIIDCKASFLPLVSVQTFLTYYRDNKEIDFAKYQEKNYKFEKLNNIKVPLFMRWWNVNEIINLPANELVDLMNEKILNNKKDINFIDGATHNYRGKEEILAEEILKFIQNIN